MRNRTMRLDSSGATLFGTSACRRVLVPIAVCGLITTGAMLSTASASDHVSCTALAGRHICAGYDSERPRTYPNVTVVAGTYSTSKDVTAAAVECSDSPAGQGNYDVTVAINGKAVDEPVHGSDDGLCAALANNLP